MLQRHIVLFIFMLSMFAPSQSFSHPAGCQPIIRQGVAKYIARKAKLRSPLPIRRQFCSKTAKVRRRGNRVVLFRGRLKMSKARFRQLKKLFCRNLSSRKLRPIINDVGRVIPKRARTSFKRCNQFVKGGGSINSVATQVGARSVVNFNITPAQGQTFSGIQSRPAGAFSCNSSTTGLQNSRFTNYPVIGSCTVNDDDIELGSSLSFDLSSGSFGFDFAGIDTGLGPVFQTGDFAANQTLTPFVQISGCSQYRNEIAVLECDSVSSYQNCLGELIAGNLKDCRANVAAEIAPEFEYTETASRTGVTLTPGANTAQITVSEGNRGGGSSSGSASYDVSFPVPSLPAATNCDPACPVNTCGANHCNRNCIKADKRPEEVTGGNGGLWSIAGVNSPSCTREISGSRSPDSIDLYRAWEACDRGNHWGSTTVIYMVHNAGKIFQMNNPTAEQVGNTWIYTNVAELYYHFRPIEIGVNVTCNQ